MVCDGEGQLAEGDYALTDFKEREAFYSNPPVATARPRLGISPGEPAPVAEVAVHLDRLTSSEPAKRVAALSILASRPRASQQLLVAAEQLLEDRTITAVYPDSYGELRWLAADAVAALRATLGKRDPVIIDDVLAPTSASRVEQLAKESGIAPTLDVIKTVERLAAAGKLPRRRISREPLV